MSIVFETANEAGTLYNLLSHIIYNGLNMNKIESRPIEGNVEGKSWNFVSLLILRVILMIQEL